MSRNRRLANRHYYERRSRLVRLVNRQNDESEIVLLGGLGLVEMAVDLVAADNGVVGINLPSRLNRLSHACNRVCGWRAAAITDADNGDPLPTRPPPPP